MSRILHRKQDRLAGIVGGLCVLLFLSVPGCGSAETEPGGGGNGAGTTDGGVEDGSGTADTASSDVASAVDTTTTPDAGATKDSKSAGDIGAGDIGAGDIGAGDIGGGKDALKGDTGSAFACLGGPECAKASSKDGCDETKCWWTDCKVTKPADEVCDGVDNDCDGKIDIIAKAGDKALCDDGNACNGTELCKKGKCAAGPIQSCLGKACQKASCDKDKGCVYTDTTAKCNDGKPCTTNDTCANGSCTGQAKECGGGSVCTTKYCDSKTGVCKNSEKSKNCDDKNPCTDDSCDPKSGCQSTPNGLPCNDGDACTGVGTQVDVCSAGKCVAGAKKSCDDGNTCTDDSCDKKKGCVKLNNGTTCDDKSACTAGEKCSKGACAGGTATVCDDKKVCTADSCDAKTGSCKFVAIAGCKPCKLATECDDKNPCTTDSCTAGKCVQAKIAGCVGPTDYYPVSIKSKYATVKTPGTWQINVTIRNDGKPFTGSQLDKMQWDVWVTSAQTIDTKTDKQIFTTKLWSGTNIGGATPQATVSGSMYLNAIAQFPANPKYMCVRVLFDTDLNQNNDILCAPLPKILFEEYEAVGIKPISKTFAAGSYAELYVAWKNNGRSNYQIKPSGIQVNFWASVDNKLSSDDVLIGAATKNLPPSGAGERVQKVAFRVSQVVREKHKYLCALVNPYRYKTEPITTDNWACKAVTFENVADFSYGTAYVSGGYKQYWVNWAGKHRCMVKGLSNAGFIAVTKKYSVRCWVSKDGKGPDKAPWSVSWTDSYGVAGASYYKNKLRLGVRKSVASPNFVAVGPSAQIGANKICVEVNYDKAIKEKKYDNNIYCRNIVIRGPDMQNDPVQTRFTASASTQLPDPTKLPRGKALGLDYSVCNLGNVKFSPKNSKLNSRVLLSLDKTPSADDHVVWSGISSIYNLTGYGKATPQKSECGALVAKTATVTLPMTLKAGAYFLIFETNYDKKASEPLYNNVTVKPVTVL